MHATVGSNIGGSLGPATTNPDLAIWPPHPGMPTLGSVHYKEKADHPNTSSRCCPGPNEIGLEPTQWKLRKGAGLANGVVPGEWHNADILLDDRFGTGSSHPGRGLLWLALRGETVWGRLLVDARVVDPWKGNYGCSVMRAPESSPAEGEIDNDLPDQVVRRSRAVLYAVVVSKQEKAAHSSVVKLFSSSHSIHLTYPGVGKREKSDVINRRLTYIRSAGSIQELRWVGIGPLNEAIGVGRVPPTLVSAYRCPADLLNEKAIGEACSLQ